MQCIARIGQQYDKCYIEGMYGNSFHALIKKAYGRSLFRSCKG